MTNAQYNALNVAIDVMNTYLAGGGPDDENKVSKSLDTLIRLARQEERKRRKDKQGGCK